jgi:hypothetical protein
MFRASLCPSSGEQEQDWLKLHVKRPGRAGCGCVEPWCRQCALFESYCLTQASSHEVLTSLILVSPDDGHNDARNMLRLIYLKKYTSNYCCICWFYYSPRQY